MMCEVQGEAQREKQILHPGQGVGTCPGFSGPMGKGTQYAEGPGLRS